MLIIKIELVVSMHRKARIIIYFLNENYYEEINENDDVDDDDDDDDDVGIDGDDLPGEHHWTLCLDCQAHTVSDVPLF